MKTVRRLILVVAVPLMVLASQPFAYPQPGQANTTPANAQARQPFAQRMERVLATEPGPALYQHYRQREQENQHAAVHHALHAVSYANSSSSTKARGGRLTPPPPRPMTYHYPRQFKPVAPPLPTPTVARRAPFLLKLGGGLLAVFGLGAAANKCRA